MLVAALAIGASVWLTAQAGPAIQRTVYITAADQRGGEPLDLSPAALTVNDGGRECAIIRVEPSRDRLKIALAVEEVLTPYNPVRRALAGFIDRLQPSADFALYVIGRRNERRVNYTPDIVRLANAINAFPNRAVDDGILVESLYDIAREQREIEGRRVIVAVATEIRQVSGVQAEGLGVLLRDGRGVLYAATLTAADRFGWPAGATSGGRRLDLEGESAGLERDKVFSDGTRQSGGLRVSVPNLEGFPVALDRIAAELTRQYAVTYRLPAGAGSNGRVTVLAARKGLTVRGPSRVPERRPDDR
jgi:hypothetical protein